MTDKNSPTVTERVDIHIEFLSDGTCTVDAFTDNMTAKDADLLKRSYNAIASAYRGVLEDRWNARVKAEKDRRAALPWYKRLYYYITYT